MSTEVIDLKQDLEFDILNRCQRNWIPNSVTSEDRITLEKVANNAPTKQNVNYFRLLSISNQDIQNQLFYIAHSESDQRHLPNNNTQMLAPLLFCWIGNIDETWERINDRQLNHENIFVENLLLNSGISAGTVLAAANAMNYDTGFCKCFDQYEMQDYFKTLGIIDDNRIFPLFFLGIGHADPTLKSNQCDIGSDIYSVRRKPLERLPTIRL